MSAIAVAVKTFASDWTDELLEESFSKIEETFVEAIPEENFDDEATMPIEVDVEALKRSPGVTGPRYNRHVTRRGV